MSDRYPGPQHLTRSIATVVCAILGGLVCLPAADAAAAANESMLLPPRFAHVVIVIMENHSASQIIGDTANAPYINSMISGSGVSFSDAHGVTHPSQPNYIALFSGSIQGVTDDSCPKNFNAVTNLGSQLIAAGFTFIGYSETMPSTGFTGCDEGGSMLYRRKHNPWVDFDNVPTEGNQPFSAFPSDFNMLPDVSIVVPNICNDMHDCPVATGDTWLQDNMDAYVQWAKTHDSLFILTWDEDDFTVDNHIPLIFAGADLVPGTYTETVDHYSVLRMLEDMYGLTALGGAASRAQITGVWDDLFSDGFESSSP